MLLLSSVAAAHHCVTEQADGDDCYEREKANRRQDTSKVANRFLSDRKQSSKHQSNTDHILSTKWAKKIVQRHRCRNKIIVNVFVCLDMKYAPS